MSVSILRRLDFRLLVQNSFQLGASVRYSVRLRIWRRHSTSAAEQRPAIIPNASRRPSQRCRSFASCGGLTSNSGFIVSDLKDLWANTQIWTQIKDLQIRFG